MVGDGDLGLFEVKQDEGGCRLEAGDGEDGTSAIL